MAQLYHEVLTAERFARDEAAGLRAELDARRTWGCAARCGTGHEPHPTHKSHPVSSRSGSLRRYDGSLWLRFSDAGELVRVGLNGIFLLGALLLIKDQ